MSSTDKADGRRKFNTPKGVPPSIEQRLVGELQVDPLYQRRADNYASTALIAHIAFNWDWRLCGALVVSRRADGFFVIDGQHRLQAAKRRGDIMYLPCLISTYDGPADEAAMFVQANRKRRPIGKLDDYRAALAAGDTAAVEVDEVLREAGLSVADSTMAHTWKPGEVIFLTAIGNALRKHGKPIVSAALTNIAEAFKGQVLIHGSALFTALVEILARPPNGFDPDVMFEALTMFDAGGWHDFIASLPGGMQRTEAMKKAVLEAYTEKAGGDASNAAIPFPEPPAADA